MSNKPIAAKRIYGDPANNVGYRVLVIRIWPLGVSKEVTKFNEFKKRYKKELV